MGSVFTSIGVDAVSFTACSACWLAFSNSLLRNAFPAKVLLFAIFSTVLLVAIKSPEHVLPARIIACASGTGILLPLQKATTKASL